LTVPAPVPDAPDVTVSHAELLTAVQVQPAGAEIDTAPVDGIQATEFETGVTAVAQLAPFCLMVTSCPATLNIAVRGVAVVFGATV
jgi:hypothetical protein